MNATERLNRLIESLDGRVGVFRRKLRAGVEIEYAVSCRRRLEELEEITAALRELRADLEPLVECV